jgi:hypothetical protein
VLWSSVKRVAQRLRDMARLETGRENDKAWSYDYTRYRRHGGHINIDEGTKRFPLRASRSRQRAQQAC